MPREAADVLLRRDVGTCGTCGCWTQSPQIPRLTHVTVTCACDTTVAMSINRAATGVWKWNTSRTSEFLDS